MPDAITAIKPNSTVQVIPDTPIVKHTAPAGDKVVLSVPAQAEVLRQQGLSVNEISQQLGISVALITSDLGITALSAAVQTPATPVATPAVASPVSSK